jgi:hypothetical protein
MATKRSNRYTERGYVSMLVDFFEHRGFYPVAQQAPGAFTRQIMFSHDGKYVLKISGPDVYQSGDSALDAYPVFAAWACTQNHPHLPKIYMARSLTYYGLFLVIMERLHHLDFDAVQSVAYGNDSPQRINTLPDSLAVNVVKACCVEKNLAYLAGEKFRTLLDGIIRITNHFGLLPTDLHAANIMMRTDGTLVFCDPYSWLKNCKVFSNVPVSTGRDYSDSRYPDSGWDNLSECKCSLCNPKTATLSYVRGVATMREQRIQELADMLMNRKQRKAN